MGDVSRNTVRAAITELEVQGFLVVERRNGVASTYTLRLPEPDHVLIRFPETESDTGSRTGSHGDPEPEDQKTSLSSSSSDYRTPTTTSDLERLAPHALLHAARTASGEAEA
jgi:hypothetical protein